MQHIREQAKGRDGAFMNRVLFAVLLSELQMVLHIGEAEQQAWNAILVGRVRHVSSVSKDQQTKGIFFFLRAH